MEVRSGRLAILPGGSSEPPGTFGQYASVVAGRLASSSSAYLRQHADNPVDWWEWSDDAFDEARRRDVPIFLSIGYAACHWCHVMAHESFEDPVVATYLNENFVSIKVDREERPDVDAVYMAATQAVSGHGGWPMSVFLLPDGRPFMAGTYYPPVDRHGSPGFQRLLTALHDGWTAQRSLIKEQADQIDSAIRHEITVMDRLAPRVAEPTAVRRSLAERLVASAQVDGGFSGAPKFPRPSYIDALLHELEVPGAVHAITTTLDAMSRRGLYDHLEGGFARYSVDAQWHVPHFEQMLSDQALLAATYLAADRAFGSGTPWCDVAIRTLDAMTSRLWTGEGFASSLDADAGGHEGLHVTWTLDDVRETLETAGLGNLYLPIVQRYRFDSSPEFEGRLIPTLADGEPFTPPALLEPALDALRKRRQERPQPGRDDKVVLEWNAMAIVALAASPLDRHRQWAIDTWRIVHESHLHEGQWWRTQSRTARATALDIGWAIVATASLYQATGDDHYLDTARSLSDYALAHYWEGEVPSSHNPDCGGGFFTTHDAVTDLSWRPKDLLDGAVPSAHSVLTRAFATLAALTSDERATVVTARLVALAGAVATDHPTAVPDFVNALGLANAPRQIVMPGVPPEWSHLVRSSFVRDAVFVLGTGHSPLLAHREPGQVYLCEAGTCHLPARSETELAEQLRALGAVLPS